MWSVIIFIFKSLGCCCRYWRSASYLSVIGSSSTYLYPNISKDSIHEDCLLILLDNRSNITLWYGTNFFIIRHNYKWEDCEIPTPRYIYPTSGLQVPIILTLHKLPLVYKLCSAYTHQIYWNINCPAYNVRCGPKLYCFSLCYRLAVVWQMIFFIKNLNISLICAELNATIVPRLHCFNINWVTIYKIRPQIFEIVRIYFWMLLYHVTQAC